jgi:hypothetical protein
MMWQNGDTGAKAWIQNDSRVGQDECTRLYNKSSGWETAYRPCQGTSHAGSSTSLVPRGLPQEPWNIQQPRTKSGTLVANTPRGVTARQDQYHVSVVCGKSIPTVDRQRTQQPGVHQYWLSQAPVPHPLQPRRLQLALPRVLQRNLTKYNSGEHSK